MSADVPGPMPETGAWNALCASEALRDAGEGVRFATADGTAAFAVRVRGEVRAFINRCPHIGVELDAWPGQFFDDDGLHLLCSVHGARFDARDGRCESGPCPGRSLQSVECREHDDLVWVRGAR